MRKAKKPEYPKVMESFHDPSPGMYLCKEPSCVNFVRIHRYRITVELIEEHVEVLIERIRKLARDSDNFHHWEPLKRAAAELGHKLDYEEFRKDARRTP